MATPALTKKRSVPPALTEWLRQDMPAISDLLPPDLPVDKFRSALWLHMQQIDWSKVNQNSVIPAIHHMVLGGFLPGVDAYLIPYKGQMTCVADYRGILRNLFRTGQVVKAFAEVVYEQDHFVLDFLADCLEHRPALKDRGEMVAVYGCIVLRSGDKHVEMMLVEDIEKIRLATPFGSREQSPWQGHYTEMAKKTVIKRAAKYVQIPPEAAQFFQDDERGPELSQAETEPPPPAAGVERVDPETGEILDPEPPAEEPFDPERSAQLDRELAAREGQETP